jgi:hypothetical protein
MTVLITMFQSDIVPAAPPPGPSVRPNTLPSEGPSIGAPGEPLGISDGSSNSTPISNKDHGTALPRQSAGLSPGDIEDLWLQEMIHLDHLKMCAEFIRCL